MNKPCIELIISKYLYVRIPDLPTFDGTRASLSENILFSILRLSPNSKAQRLDKFIIVKLKLFVTQHPIYKHQIRTSCTVSSQDSTDASVTPFSYLTHVNIVGSDINLVSMMFTANTKEAISLAVLFMMTVMRCI